MKALTPDGTLQMYVNDMIALERALKEIVGRQCDDADAAAVPRVSALLREIEVTTDARLSALTDLATRFGHSTGKVVKETVAGASGILTGWYEKLRKHPVSRMLRDDYAALSLAATAYSMLYTTGVALRDARVSALAHRHMREITPLVMQLSRLIPVAVTAELMHDFATADPSAEHSGVEATEEAWAQHVASPLHS